jgi:hypothetical protein
MIDLVRPICSGELIRSKGDMDEDTTDGQESCNLHHLVPSYGLYCTLHLYAAWAQHWRSKVEEVYLAKMMMDEITRESDQ